MPAANLVDELCLLVEPIVLGGGKTTFPDTGEARPFDLMATQTTNTGVRVNHYRRAG